MEMQTNSICCYLCTILKSVSLSAGAVMLSDESCQNLLVALLIHFSKLSYLHPGLYYVYSFFFISFIIFFSFCDDFFSQKLVNYLSLHLQSFFNAFYSEEPNDTCLAFTVQRQ